MPTILNVFEMFSIKCFENVLSQTFFVSICLLNVRSDVHSYKHRRFSVIQWLGNTINSGTLNVVRAKEFDLIFDGPIIHPIGINLFV